MARTLSNWWSFYKEDNQRVWLFTICHADSHKPSFCRFLLQEWEVKMLLCWPKRYTKRKINKNVTTEYVSWLKKREPKDFGSSWCKQMCFFSRFYGSIAPPLETMCIEELAHLDEASSAEIPTMKELWNFKIWKVSKRVKMRQHFQPLFYDRKTRHCLTQGARSSLNTL